MGERRFHTCMLCEAMCGLEVEVEGDRVVRVRGDADDPLSRGHICPKATAIEDVRTDPDRILAPLVRGPDGALREASWDEALAVASERIVALQAAHGPHAVAVYTGNPTVHSAGAVLGMLALQTALDGRSNFSATSVDQLPHQLAAYTMFGNQLLLPVPDVDRAQLFIVVGANPLASNGSLMSAPGIHDRLRALRARGGRLVVVDPRRTETAAIADTHLAIQPGTDALFLLALLHVLVQEGLMRPGRLAALTDGLDRLAALSAPFSPEAVGPVTDVAPAALRGLARDLAASEAAAVYGRMGISTQHAGGSAAWLVNVLNVVTGNLDRPGGVLFTTPAIDLVSFANRVGKQGSYGRFRTRVRGLPEFGGEQPVAALAEEMETPGDQQIRGLITLAGNPVLSTPDGARLDRAIAKLDFVLSVDIYKNATTRHAHVVLPTSFGYERDHYDLILHALAVRNTARFAPALFPPAGQTRDDFAVLTALGAAVAGRRKGAAARATALALSGMRRMGARRVLDLLLRVGPHHLSLAALQRAPHGVDLGPLEPRLPGVLATRDRRIALVPAPFAADLPRLQAMLSAPRADGLVLIGRRLLRANNSWMHNSARLTKGKPACTLLVHPADAERLGLVDGGAAELGSASGQVVVTVEVSDEMKRGVVSLPHGFGHARPGVALRVAGALPGASANDVTDARLVDPVSGNAALNGVPVTVRPIAARAAEHAAGAPPPPA